MATIDTSVTRGTGCRHRDIAQYGRDECSKHDEPTGRTPTPHLRIPQVGRFSFALQISCLTSMHAHRRRARRRREVPKETRLP